MVLSLQCVLIQSVLVKTSPVCTTLINESKLYKNYLYETLAFNLVIGRIIDVKLQFTIYISQMVWTIARNFLQNFIGGGEGSIQVSSSMPVCQKLVLGLVFSKPAKYVTRMLIRHYPITFSNAWKLQSINYYESIVPKLFKRLSSPKTSLRVPLGITGDSAFWRQRFQNMPRRTP